MARNNTENHHDLFDSRYLTSNIKQRSVRGGAVTMVAQGCRFAFRTASTVVLARILTPADFGLIAMVLAVTNFATMFKDAGLTEATLQRENISHEQVSTLFWINAGFGVTIAAVVAALAPGVAWFYDEPRLLSVTVTLATMFVFSGLASQHQALLRRHMAFTKLGVVDIVAMFLSVAIAIVAGISGAGYWSLVYMHVALAFCTAVGHWLAMRWVPGLPRRGVSVRDMLGFGAHVTGFNFTNYFSRNADNLLIGRFLGSSALGLYSKAYGLLMLPISQVRQPLMSVGLPSLSRLQNEPWRYQNYYRKLMRMLAFMTIPMTLLLGVFSYEVVLLVLGPQWVSVSEIFRILAFAALVQSLSGTTGMVMLSSGSSKRYLRLGMFSTVVAVLSFAIGLQWGIRGVAFSYTIANYLFLLPAVMYAFKETPITLRLFFGATLLPLAAALFAAFGSKALFLLARTAMDQWVAFSLSLVAACLLYFATMSLLPGGTALLKEIQASLTHLGKPTRQSAS